MPMDETLFDNLSLLEKAKFIQEKGQFIESQDFYSFFILVYILNQHQVKLLYDFNGLIVDVEQEKEMEEENYVSSQLESCLDDGN